MLMHHNCYIVSLKSYLALSYLSLNSFLLKLLYLSLYHKKTVTSISGGRGAGRGGRGGGGGRGGVRGGRGGTPRGGRGSVA